MYYAVKEVVLLKKKKKEKSFGIFLCSENPIKPLSSLPQ
jgi:hypothetical protein